MRNGLREIRNEADLTAKCGEKVGKTMKAKHFILKLKSEIKNEFIVTNAYPAYEWEDGKPTDRKKGWTLRTICPSAQFEETMIQVDGENPPIDLDKLEEEPMYVVFENLEFSQYYSSKLNKVVYTAHATGLHHAKSVKTE